MEKVDAGNGIMEVEVEQRQDDPENPSVEDDSQLLQKDTEILLGLLPASVWLYVNNMLLDDHLTDDLKSLSNASPFFRDLMYSKRVLFLFPEVLTMIGPQLENEERVNEKQKSNILTCRSVCKSWNKSVENYIDAAAKPDFFQAPPTPQSVPRNPILMAAKYKYFGFMAPQRLQQFLTYFDQSHWSEGPQRNPFIGTTVALCGEVSTRGNIKFGENLLTLLRKYGQHIRVMALGLSTSTNDQLQDYLWLKECIELTPNLTHLKVKQRPIDQGFGGNIGTDPDFGEHAYRTVGTEEYLRKRILDEFGAVSAALRQHMCRSVLNMHRIMLLGRRADQREEQIYNMDETLASIIEHLGQRSEFWRIHGQQGVNVNVIRIRYQPDGNQRRLQNENAPAPARLTENEYMTSIADIPLPALKNLECLKLCRLYARVFNPLIQSNRHASWLHIEPIIPYPEMERYVDWWTYDFPNLRKLYIKFSGGPGPEEVRTLRNFHPSFMKLTSLHFDYPATNQYIGWDEVFQILEQNWADTLTELKIRLPEPRTVEDKEDVKNACENGRLALPKLKRLVMWKGNPRDNEGSMRNFHFLNTVKENLEEFVVL